MAIGSPGNKVATSIFPTSRHRLIGRQFSQRNMYQSYQDRRPAYGSNTDDAPELADEYCGQKSGAKQSLRKTYSSPSYSRNHILPSTRSYPILPASYASYADSISTNDPRRKDNSKSFLTVMKILIAITLCYVCKSNNNRVKTTSEERDALKKEMDNMNNEMEDAQSELDHFHYDFESLHSEILAARFVVDTDYGIGTWEHSMSPRREEARDDIVKKHDRQLEKIQMLQNHIQTHHRTELVKR